MQRLAVVPAAGGAPEVVAATAEMGTGAPVFTADGKSLLTTIGEDRVDVCGGGSAEGQGA